MDSRKDARAASAGAILVTRLMQRGVAGVVTDGGFRDSAEIAKLGFPAFHHRPSAPTNLTLHQAIEINVPIGCGDAPVFPGDVIFGDSDGVIVDPRASRRRDRRRNLRDDRVRGFRHRGGPQGPRHFRALSGDRPADADRFRGMAEAERAVAHCQDRPNDAGADQETSNKNTGGNVHDDVRDAICLRLQVPLPHPRLISRAAGAQSFPFTPNQRYPDPAVQILDPGFAKYRIYSSTVEQVATGMRWAEGPAYFPEGGYLLFSDIPNNRIMKFDEKTSTDHRVPQPTPTTPTATRGIARAASSPASIRSPAASPAPRRTARSRCWPTSSRASG